jgi:hypothetical protein
MKHLLTFDEFLNESLNEAKTKLEDFSRYRDLEDVLKGLDSKISSIEPIRYAPKSAETKLTELADKNISSFIISINEDESIYRKGSSWVITGIVSDKKGTKAVTGVGKKAGDMAYLIGRSDEKWEEGNPWTLGQLGLAAQFASGGTKALTPVKDHLWQHTQLNKIKGTANYLVTIK